MDFIPPKRSRAKLIQIWGSVLFVISFLTPNWHFEGMGIGAFLAVPFIVCTKVSEGDVFTSWQYCALLGSLCFGWLSNFTVLFSLPRGLAVLATAGPWILYCALVFLGNAQHYDPAVVGFLPFYPWALGIAMIHYPSIIGYAGTSPAFPPRINPAAQVWKRALSEFSRHLVHN